MSDLVLGLCLIVAALAVAVRSHRDKGKLRRALKGYPVDCFPRHPRERYTLSPTQMQAVKDLVDSVGK